MSELVNVQTGEVAPIDPKSATAEELEQFAVTVREWIPDMDEDQLDALEVMLTAVAKRLRILKGKAAEAEASRALTLVRMGDLLGQGSPGNPNLTKSEDSILQKVKIGQQPLTAEQMRRRHTARLLHEFQDFVRLEIEAGLAKQPPRVSPSKLVKQCQRRRSVRDVPMSERRYSVLLADPPWAYEAAESATRQIENQYGTMSLERIKALGDRIPAAEDAVLFCWVTSPKLPDGLAVLKAWDFEYRTCMVWVKDRIGMGYYARQQHELLLIAKRGSLPVPAPEHRPSSVFEGQRTEHSAKPEIVHELIEAMYPEYERTAEATDFFEMFARTKREGWDRWELDTSL